MMPLEVFEALSDPGVRNAGAYSKLRKIAINAIFNELLAVVEKGYGLFVQLDIGAEGGGVIQRHTRQHIKLVMQEGILELNLDHAPAYHHLFIQKWFWKGWTF